MLPESMEIEVEDYRIFRWDTTAYQLYPPSHREVAAIVTVNVDFAVDKLLLRSN
ncbi:MAG TPA: hypothetical protein VEP67_01115 [Thiobacillaceae bacterium]|nr:hypothetical protein [Thiobacillaceae bacterium]